MMAVNAPPQYSDQESLDVTEQWSAGERERAAFMNASPDEVGKWYNTPLGLAPTLHLKTHA